MKTVLRWIVQALILTFAFSLLAAFEEEAHRGAAALFEASPWLVLSAIGLYLTTVVASAVNWWLLITRLGQPIGLGTAVEVFFTSQAGKYIPGNFGHLLGRVALGVARRIGGVAIAQSLAIETALTILAGVAAAYGGFLAAENGLLLIHAVSSIEVGISVPLWLAGALAFAGIMAAACLWRPLGRRVRVLAEPLGRLTPLVFCSFLVIQLLVFGLLGIVLVILARALGLPQLGIGYAVAGSAVAWLAGFVTPGAPGGIGVREMLLVACFAPVLGTTGALAAALLLRVVTMTGDLLAFLVGLALGWAAARSGSAAITADSSP